MIKLVLIVLMFSCSTPPEKVVVVDKIDKRIQPYVEKFYRLYKRPISKNLTVIMRQCK